MAGSLAAGRDGIQAAVHDDDVRPILWERRESRWRADSRSSRTLPSAPQCIGMTNHHSPAKALAAFATDRRLSARTTPSWNHARLKRYSPSRNRSVPS